MKQALLFCLSSILASMASGQKLDSLHSPVQQSDTLQNKELLNPVTVYTNPYKADSIRNRKVYESIFDYRKKPLNMGDNKWNRTIMVMGKKVSLDPQKSLSLLDINSLSHVIASKKDKQKQTLQARLVQEEQEKYIDHIFTPALVERFSNIHDDDSLHSFITRYAPSYTELQSMNELDLGKYIMDKTKLFRQK